MKKLFFLAALAGVALVSCTKNEVAPSDNQNEITFAAPVVGPQMKSQHGEIPVGYNENEHFAVYAVHYNGASLPNWAAGTLYMGTATNGLECLKQTDENYWAPAKPYYWPKEGTLSFAAYSPFDVTGSVSYGANGLKVENHTVSTNIAEHVDFLYAQRVYNYSTSTEEADDDNTVYGYTGVNLMFQHAMSSIVFRLAKDSAIDASTTISLKKITLANPYSVGTFNENVTDGATYAAAPFWSDRNTQASFVTYDSSVHLTTTLTEYVTGNADIILIPQDLTNDVKVILNYTITSPGRHEIAQESTIQLNTKTAAWGMGTRYIYNITIGLEEIKFDPAVTAWTNADEVNIAL